MGRQANVTLFIDESNPTSSMQVIQGVGYTINAVGNKKATATVGMLEGLANRTIDPEAVIQPINMEACGTVAGNTSYFEFVAPGMLILVVIMSIMIGIPRGISYEKEVGTFDGILSAPVNMVSIILGKMAAQTLRGLIQGAAVMLMAVLFFGVVIRGNILLSFSFR